MLGESEEPTAPSIVTRGARGSVALGFVGGVLCTLILFVLACLAIYLSYAQSREPERQAKSSQTFSDELAEEMQSDVSAARSDNEHLAAELHERLKDHPDSSVDFLIISGGADLGSFGTGFLLGWGQVPPGADGRPHFDGVSGVSVGGLIAPFAFVGTDESYKTIDQAMRHPRPDLARTRGWFFFLPDNVSFADVSGLEEQVSSLFDLSIAERIVEADKDYRILLVQSSDLDLGEPQEFDLVHAARQALAMSDPEIMRRIVLASSAMPAAFPPREIGGSLYADGAIICNIYYGSGARGDRDNQFGTVWRRLYPEEPVPKVRYWVILNECIQSTPSTVQPKWPNLVQRTIQMATVSAQRIALRHLYAMAEASRLRGDGEIEVRWVAVPDTWKRVRAASFNPENMQNLSDLGRRMGADPRSWMTEAP